MKICQSCGFENPAESKFCKKCGTKFEEKKVQRFCRFCGKEAPEGTLFCTGCGKPLQAPAQNTAANTKQTNGAQTKPTAQVKTNPVQVNQPEAPISQEQPVVCQENKKKNIIPIIIVAIIAIVAIAVGIVFGMQNNAKDDEKDSDKDTKVETEMTEESEEVEETEIEEADEINLNVDRTAPIPVAATVTASSSLDNDAYAAASINDSNAATAWAEGVAGFGEGEYLTYTFGAETDIYGMAILPGNQGTIENYSNYGRPLTLEITAGDVTQTIDLSSYNPSFDFTGNPYVYVDFDEPVRASEVQISIADVYESVTVDATCIAELHLYTYPATGENSGFSVDAWKVVHVKATDYILPTSNIEYLTMEDLEGLTAEECRIARNELYARYGRKFTDETLKAYFESKEWYEGTIETEDFQETMLNEYEVANRDLIVEYETLKGYR